MTRCITELRTPPGGVVTDASGVAHTAAVATTVINNVPKNAIHHTRSPSRWSAQDFPPSLASPPRVPPTSMITVARVGVIDQTTARPYGFESSPVALITSAAATAG